MGVSHTVIAHDSNNDYDIVRSIAGAGPISITGNNIHSMVKLLTFRLVSTWIQQDWPIVDTIISRFLLEMFSMVNGYIQAPRVLLLWTVFILIVGTTPIIPVVALQTG